MKKRIAAVVMAAAMSACLLAGCGSTASDTASTAASEAATAAETVAEEAASEAETAAEEAATEASTELDTLVTESGPALETEDPSYTLEDAQEILPLKMLQEVDTTVRVGSLKGPTTMGLVNLMADAEAGNAYGTYEFKMASDPSEIVSDLTAGNIDIALIPANLAATVYNKTNGGISVIDINTLGVLYCVTGDDSITSVADLAGKTVLSTGQGATPEYAIEYLLEQNGIEDCTLEFYSEASEIAALLQEDPTQIAVLPQPFATAAQLQNENIHEAFALTDAWSSVTDASQLITGVTVVSNEFLAENELAVALFEMEHIVSAAAINEDPAAGGELCATYGIVEKAPLATKAIPKCGITVITNDDMEGTLSGYLQTLYDANPTAVGGTLPGEDFYYHVSNFVNVNQE